MTEAFNKFKKAEVASRSSLVGALTQNYSSRTAKIEEISKILGAKNDEWANSSKGIQKKQENEGKLKELNEAIDQGKISLTEAKQELEKLKKKLAETEKETGARQPAELEHIIFFGGRGDISDLRAEIRVLEDHCTSLKIWIEQTEKDRDELSK
jgi:polyhydroxyalkanoate synthesis regulator phasin